MREDTLKSLFAAEEPAPAPAQDIAFVIAVMEKVERRRLLENLALWSLAGAALTVVLALIMPFLTPVLIQSGQEIIPAAVVLVALATMAIGWPHIRPALRDFGLPV